MIQPQKKKIDFVSVIIIILKEKFYYKKRNQLILLSFFQMKLEKVWKYLWNI